MGIQIQGGGALKGLCKLQWIMARFSGAGPLGITTCRQSEAIEWAPEYLWAYVLWLLVHNLSSHRIGSAGISINFAAILRTNTKGYLGFQRVSEDKTRQDKTRPRTLSQKPGTLIQRGVVYVSVGSCHWFSFCLDRYRRVWSCQVNHSLGLHCEGYIQVPPLWLTCPSTSVQ
jgi:hypothetical protein